MATRAARGMELRIKRTFDATAERVFRAFTEAEALKRWKAPGDSVVELAEADVRVGGRYRVHMRGPDGTAYRLAGEYREVVPSSRLVFTWRWETDPAEKETLVTVDFTAIGERTEIELVHSGFVNEADRDGHGKGWNGCFPKLDRLLAT